MNHRIIWTRKAATQYQKADPPIKKLVARKIDLLIKDPSVFPFLSGNLSGLQKLKFNTLSGEYRIVFSFVKKEKTVVIVFMGTRENFYKALQRYL